MRLRAAVLWIFFAAFVAYLSFVPFRFQPLGFDEALARFAQIRYLDLGAGSRADWVANILMFVPLGWLAAAFFAPRPRGRFDPAAVIPSLLLGTAWAVAVEFGQLYFPGRTVSVNDIVAEVIGTLLGAWLWSAFGSRSRDWWHTLLEGGRATANAALAGYLLAYLVLSFSPFDFVVSIDEFANKLHSPLNGWWLAPVSCGRTPCSVKLLAEVLAVLPLGWWWAGRRRDVRGTLLSAAVLGATLGLVIELAQFLLVSGTSQGASLASRAVGAAAGAWLHSRRHAILGVDWVRWGRPLVIAGLLPYLAAVGYVGGWFGGRWLGLEAGMARADQIRWMPFFYQYFSTEQALIRSTLLHLCLYAPVGVAVWLWGRRSGLSSGWIAAVLAGLIAVVAETGKLFIQGRHPDYTDVLFAAVAAWTAATLLRWAARSDRSVAVAPPPQSREGDAPPRRDTLLPELAPSPRLPDAVGAGDNVSTEAVAKVVAPAFTSRAIAVLLVAVAAVSLLGFPVWQLPLAVGLAAYAWLLARQPLAYLLVVPVALPLLDLAPLSGRFFWDEFDFLLATTLGIRLLTAGPQAWRSPDVARTALWLLALSVLASASVALWPPAPLDANAFTSYLSPYNALRVAKGYLWGGVLLWLLWRDVASGQSVAPRLLRGLGLGLLAATLGVFWERMMFVGLADLGAWFRAAGLVSATHVGGAYLESILVALAPCALALAVGARSTRTGAAWLLVSVLGAVAVLMTLSRAAAAAWVIAVAAFAAFWLLGSRRPATSMPARHRRWTAAAVIGLLAATAILAQSTYLRDRLAHSNPDLAVRLSHWWETIELMRGDPLHIALGMGLGSFPREFYLAHGAPLQLAAARAAREPESGRTFLSLNGGRSMYVDQRVVTAPGRELRLKGLVRGSRENAELSIALCEKSFLSSVRCDWTRVPATTGWQPFETRLAVPNVPAARIGLRPPVSVSLHSSAFGARVDVTQLSLLDGSSELLSNGAFDHGLDHWLVFSDVHLAWRALSTPVQVVFEQGLLGVLAWLSLAVGFVAIVVRRAGEPAVWAASAAAIGFVAVACFDTLLDSPRQIVLAALLFGLTSTAGHRPAGPTKR